MIRRYLEQLVKKFKNGKSDFRILDFGCGKGENLIHLLSCGIKGFGTDVDLDSLKIAKTTLVENGFDSNLIQPIKVELEGFFILNEGDYRLPFNDCYFDFIYSIQVFEHISNLEDVLREVNRILKPDGAVYLEFPLKYTPWEGHFRMPFLHWIPDSNFRKKYIEFCFSLGIGVHQDLGVEVISKYMNDSVFYRSFHEVNRELSKYFRIVNYAHYSLQFSMRSRFGLEVPLFFLWPISLIYNLVRVYKILLVRK